VPDLENETEQAVRKRMGAVRRPLFLPVALFVVVGLPLGLSVALTRLSSVRPDVSPLLALGAGILATIGILGHSPASYPDPATGQYALYWAPRTTRIRIASAGVALALVVVGVVIDVVAR